MDSKAFDIALLKVKQELTAYELFISEKNNERLKILDFIAQQEQAQKSIETKINESGFIAPSFIFFNRQFNYEDKQKQLKRVTVLENELFAVKKEYLKIKEKQNKLLEMKDLKEKEIAKLITLKEEREAFNDFAAKKALDNRR